MIFLLVLAGGLTGLLPRIPQNPRYHLFADSRMLFGIPNFWNVVSNFPFCIIGIAGLGFILKTEHRPVFRDANSRIAWLFVFVRIFAVGIGSGYYHLEPDNERLVWDRLPMTIVFMSLSASILSERMNSRVGLVALIVLNSMGIWSVLYWQSTERIHLGDLRPYAFVQFAPMLLLPALLLLYRKGPSLFPGLFFVFVCYVLAKVGEYFDSQIFGMLGLLSGHTLKHVAAGASVFFLYRILVLRKKVINENPFI